MLNGRTQGLTNKFAGQVQQGLGKLTGSRTDQVEGAVNRAKGSALDVFGRGLTALESQIDRAPSRFQPQARRAVDVARERPWLTLAGIAAIGFFVARSGRRR